MNVVNRVLLIVLALAMLVGAGVVLLVTLGLVAPARLAPTAWLRDRLEPFTGLDGPDQAWAVGVCLGLLLLGLLLLIVELRPARREARLTLSQDERGRVTVARDGIAALVNRETTQVPGVMEARAQVLEEKGRLRIRERVSVDPSASLPELTQDVQLRVKDAVEHHLGWPVADVQVDAQLQPLDKRRRVR